MPSMIVRPFRRSDREQVTRLVNAHAQAVVPGVSASVATVLAQLEREPGESITDPWVRERATMVAEQAGRVVAAAHLLRYHADERAGASYRGAGEIRWFLYWPEAPAGNPYWQDATAAAGRLISACLARLREWAVTTLDAGGELPVHGVYGVPEQWPHIRALYQRAGFAHTGHTEVVYLARVADLPRPASPPLPELTVRRSVGISGTRLAAVLGAEALGYVELELLAEGERLPRSAGWADIGNLRVADGHRRRGIGTWLLGQAADWLALAQVGRLLDYAWLDDEDQAGYRRFLLSAGFRELTRTARGWTRDPGRPG
ncbi:MAG: GNAT family N-acetyltransferase [Actinobacteria bacterium]|nr:GNAT family N-acetyltransferase [Actinomycetota bacterium]MBO0786873.1 GNAT family N-acetyltransferase [Actinomycetota bacterium]